MPTIKQILATVGLAIAGTMMTGVIAFLNEVHLEVSFDKLKDFRITDLASWTKLGTALRFDLETASPQEFVAYWVDYDQGKAIVRRSAVSYKNFRLRNRISGVLIDDDDKTSSYAITGYYNTYRIVFSHRGAISGAGVYILNSVQLDNIATPIHVGYAIIEDVVVPGTTDVRLLQCPFIMIDEATATKEYSSTAAAKTAFPFLNGSCAPFKMPENVTTTNANG